MKLPAIDPPGLLLAIALGVCIAVPVSAAIPRREMPPKKLARVLPTATLADYGAGLVTAEARYCRGKRGVPFGHRFCDFGACGPCQPEAWPCSVRTIVCDGEGCSWGGKRTQ